MTEMKTSIWWYKKGWNHCIELLKEMTNGTEYDSWDDMISELEGRFKEEAKP